MNKKKTQISLKYDFFRVLWKAAHNDTALFLSSIENMHADSVIMRKFVKIVRTLVHGGSYRPKKSYNYDLNNHTLR